MKIETALQVASKARLHPPRSADAVRDNRGRFLPGHTAAGPGKPVGGRGRLSAAFIDDLLREWPGAAVRVKMHSNPSCLMVDYGGYGGFAARHP
jgi:hypothetical protein